MNFNKPGSDNLHVWRQRDVICRKPQGRRCWWKSILPVKDSDRKELWGNKMVSSSLCFSVHGD